MQMLLALPTPVQLGIVFLVSLMLASALNFCIVRLSWFGKPVGPWFAPAEGASPRIWQDYVPVFGWLLLQRDTKHYWPRFWLRPVIVEILFAAGIAALYWWEVLQGGLVPESFRFAGQVNAVVPEEASVCLTRFALHVLLIWGMAVATLIDMDEQTIPDAITVPGTLIALLAAIIVPWAALPELGKAGDSIIAVPVTMVSPAIAIPQLNPAGNLVVAPWPPALDAATGLAMGLVFYACWIFAIAPKTIWWRSGSVKMVRYMVASFLRDPRRWWYILALVAGGAVIVVTWALGGTAWHGLLSALTGMAFGGGLVWGVRVVGTYVLGREAMGFGDVTLMAMIGAFFGWQASLIVFFFAPFAGAVIAIVQWLITRSNVIAFGPFLCAAALFVLIRWSAIWQKASGVFTLGWRMPIVILFCLGLMGIMLTAWQKIKFALMKHPAE